jgi:hypothetical protein
MTISVSAILLVTNLKQELDVKIFVGIGKLKINYYCISSIPVKLMCLPMVYWISTGVLSQVVDCSIRSRQIRGPPFNKTNCT